MFYVVLFWKEKGTGTEYRRVPSQEINTEKYRTNDDNADRNIKGKDDRNVSRKETILQQRLVLRLAAEV